jgi:uncharacterized protein involved in outer membrane biogenesis
MGPRSNCGAYGHRPKIEDPGGTMKPTRVRKIVLWAGGAVALYAVLGYLVAPPIVRSQLERILSEQLGRTVTVERVRINPFALTASVHNFNLKEQDGGANAVSFDELYVNVALSSLFRLAPVIEAVRLSKPFVRVVRHDDKTYNFQDIIDRFSGAPAAPPGPSGPPPRFAVYNIELSDGRIEFDDRPEKTQHALTDLRIGVPFVSSLSSQVDIKVQPLLSAKVNGTPFELAGETKPFTDTGETTVQLDVDDLQLAKYLEYSPVPLRIRVPSGRLDTKLVLSVATLKGQLRTLILSGSASLQDLRVQQADGAPLAAIARLSVDLDSVDLLRQHAMIKAVRIDAPELDIKRFKDGGLNLASVVPAAPAAAAAAPAKLSGPPFAFSVGEIALANGKVRFVDESTEKPARFALRNLSLKVSALGNAPGTKAGVKFSTYTEAKGKLAYDGSLQLVPPRTEGNLELANLRLGVLAPYIEQVLNVVVAGGTFSTKGRLAVEVPEGQPLRLAYRGDARVPDFAVLDKPTSQDLLRWKSLAVKGIDVELDPLKVVVGEITLSDFFSRLIVNADGTLNLQALLKDTAPPASAGTPPASPSASPPNIRLGKVVLRGGSVTYSDFFVTPNYTVMLTDVGGSVTAITPDMPGDVELHGRIHQTAPVEITGKVNPLARELFVDMRASARDIELSPMSPYSVKYAGYGIEMGRLSVKLAYRIENGKLAAENNIYLDQLTFGERVGSRTATQLPVLLAVALLKDRNGVIDVNVPISGSLENPEFSVGGIITQVVGNLIVKTVSKPFAMLGSLVGGGEELAFVEFAPGSAKLGASDETKLKTLAKALDSRPGLRLDVSGRIGPDADRDALKRAGLDRQVKAAKVKDSGATVEDPAALDGIAIQADEYEKYLAAAYRARDLPKDLSTPEMERLMLASVQVTDDELRLLAQARAQATKDWLVAKGKISAVRIFIVAPKLSAEEITDQGKATRVDFSLR